MMYDKKCIEQLDKISTLIKDINNELKEIVVIKVLNIYEIDYKWSDSKELLHDLVAQITDDSEKEYQSLDTKLRKFGVIDDDILFYSTGETEDKLVKDLKDNDIIVKNIKVYDYANG